MDYENLKTLNEAVENDEFDYPDTINVAGIDYSYVKSSTYGIDEMARDKVGMVVYTTEDKDLPEEMEENLLFLAGVKPFGVVPFNEAAAKKAKKKPKAAAGPNPGGIKSDIMNNVKSHLEKHGSKHEKERDKLLQNVEKMIAKHEAKMDKMNGDHDKRMTDLDHTFKELISTHNDAVDKLGSHHDDSIGDVRSALDDLKRAHQDHIEQMRKDHDEHVRRVSGDHQDNIYRMKRDHGDKLHDLKRGHEDQLRKAHHGHEDRLNKTMRSHEENQEQMVAKHQGQLNDVQSKHDESKIGTVADVKILSLRENPTVEGKVDTGATICSLHAEKMQVNSSKERVAFLNREISPGEIVAPIASMSSVKSADGGLSYRPVIMLNLLIKGKVIEKVEVNLNDREQMSHPFLIGHNALEKGKFIIDPSYVGEDTIVNFDELQELFLDA